MSTDHLGEGFPQNRLWTGESEGGNAEVELATIERRASLRDYLSSYEVLELLACVCCILPGIFLEFAPPDPRQRPIPFQALESTGDIVVNQVYNESFDGETFSSKFTSTARPLYLRI